MELLDWLVLSVYFLSLLVFSFFLGKKHKDGKDYYLAGKKMGALPLALSLSANQISAISLIGAPAFVAIKAGGGMKWLQYELAVPLAMIAIILVFVPVFRKLSGASIYEYLEKRFSLGTRLIVSTIFLVSRGMATGVVLYTSAIVLAVTMDQSPLLMIILVGIIAIVYTTMGGLEADVYSDALQLTVLVLGTLVALIVVLIMTGGNLEISPDRSAVIDFQSTGIGDGQDFAFWPMLIGGFFLYVSYYGCDQSQTQRILSARSDSEAKKSLMINGLIRFPIVLLYCLLGLALAGFLAQNQGWIATHGIDKDPNYLVPVFIVEYFPAGLAGLVMAGIFAATMSSIDSNINSMSAVVMNDFLSRFMPQIKQDKKTYLLISRILTAFWGIFCLISGYLISSSSKTVIELVNMIGSAFYGPVLAVFTGGLLIKKVGRSGAILGLISGLVANLYCAVHLQAVSWLWWNVIGFAAAIFVMSILPARDLLEKNGKRKWTVYAAFSPSLSHGESLVKKDHLMILAGGFVLILVILLSFQILLNP